MSARVPFWQRMLIRYMERRYNSVPLSDGTHLVRMSDGLYRWIYKDSMRGWYAYEAFCRERGLEP